MAWKPAPKETLCEVCEGHGIARGAKYQRLIHVERRASFLGYILTSTPYPVLRCAEHAPAAVKEKA